MLKVLIIEDELEKYENLKADLNFNGFETELAVDSNTALTMVGSDNYDFILANHSVLEKSLNITSFEIPIFFYNSNSKETFFLKDKDQHRDLLKKKSLGLQTIRFGELSIDPKKRMTTLMGQFISMGKKEFKILALLAKRSGEIVTRENILDFIYEKSEPFDRTVDSHISHLRKKIRKVAGRSLQITAVYGLGYKLEWKSDHVINE